MNLMQLTAYAGGGLAAASLYWMLQMDLPPVNPAEPGIGSSYRDLDVQVELEPVRPVVHYAGAKDDSWRFHNPFVPWATREAEIATKKAPPKPVVRVIPKPTRPIVIKPPVVEAPPKPSIAPIGLSGLTLPKVIGGLQRGEHAVLQVVHGDERATMAIGDTIGSWTLVEISGNDAWFADAEDIRQRVPIGVASRETAIVAGGAQIGGPGLPGGFSLPTDPTGVLPALPGMNPDGRPRRINGGALPPTQGGAIPGGPNGPSGGGQIDGGVAAQPGGTPTSEGGTGGNTGGGANPEPETNKIGDLDLNSPEVQRIFAFRPDLKELAKQNPQRAARDIKALLENFKE